MYSLIKKTDLKKLKNEYYDLPRRWRVSSCAAGRNSTAGRNCAACGRCLSHINGLNKNVIDRKCILVVESTVSIK